MTVIRSLYGREGGLFGEAQRGTGGNTVQSNIIRKGRNGKAKMGLEMGLEKGT